MKIHLAQRISNTNDTVCGISVPTDKTRYFNYQVVTCGNCKRTKEYKSRLPGAAK